MSIRKILAKKLTLEASPSETSPFEISTSDPCKDVFRKLYESAPKPLTIHWTKKDVTVFWRQYRDWYTQLEQLANKE